MNNIWDKEITYLKGVGPKRALVLQQELGIFTYEQLLSYYPRKYVDRSNVSNIHNLTGSEHQVTLLGKITQISRVDSKRGRGRLTATFTDGSGFIELNWFQGIKWLEKSLKPHEEIAIFGKPTRYGGRLQISHPEIDYLTQQGDDQRFSQGITPYYPSNDKLHKVGLDSRGLRSIIRNLIIQNETLIEENLNTSICHEYKLFTHREAMINIHFPEDYEKLKQAIRRLKFEELFFFQLLLAKKRAHSKQSFASNPFTHIGAYFHTFYSQHLPFELTQAQKRVLKEIRKDLALPVQMNRLVQGDVGSGKTMVAFMSMLMAKDNGFQSALMAPTAILAEQHVKKLSAYSSDLGIEVGLIVGGQKKSERNIILEAMAEGTVDIVIGTHALIEEPVQFANLGLVVVDEQHKFGVMQRARLWQKAAPFPHNLLMSATPIPRTLAMTLYGDIDVSVIDELPPGRKPIQTMVRGESKRLEVLGFIKKQIEQGKQAYVIYPLVEESEKLDLLAATEGVHLMEKYFAPFKIGLVHGRMNPEDKEIEMQRFVKNETQVLVSTTVIEVGVDVSNATVMLIENAERFGLSQLHQLRGRVGRGADQSYCILMAGKKVSNEGRARLKAMAETNNGFNIAEIDLKLRGPGDFLGTRQSGIPEFALANIAEDQSILQVAREVAFSLQQQDPDLSLPANSHIRKYYRRYAKRNARLASFA